MFQFCFFISLAYSYCVETKPYVPPVVEYKSVIARSAELIARYEAPNWPPLEAYPDTKGWSIGYGTRSYAGERITKQEAFRRFQAILSDSVNRVMQAYPDATEDQIVWLTSIYYNCWSGWLEIRKYGFVVINRQDFCLPPWYGGLVARRYEEKQLILY